MHLIAEQLRPLLEQTANAERRIRYHHALATMMHRRERFVTSDATLAHGQAQLDAANTAHDARLLAEARSSLEFLLLWRGDTDDAQTDGANARAHAATPRTRWRSGTAERWFIRSRGRPCGRWLSSVSKRSGTRWSWHWPSGFCHPSSKGCRQRSKPSWATRWRPIGQVIRPPREPASGRRWPRPSRQAMTRRLPLAGVSARDASSAASDQTPDGGRRSRRLRKKY